MCMSPRRSSGDWVCAKYSAVEGLHD
jgi:hypothetical protein